MTLNKKPHQVTKAHYGCKLKYSRRWDAYWCLSCDEWAEPKCKDKDCEYCADRPEHAVVSIE